MHLLALGTAHTGVEECYEGSGGAQHGGLGNWRLGKGVRKGTREPGLPLLCPLTIEEFRNFHPSSIGETEAYNENVTCPRSHG